MSTLVKNKTTGDWECVNKNIVAEPFLDRRSISRGVIFDPTDRHGIIIKRGWECTIYDENDVPQNYRFLTDTHFNLGTLTAGKAYTVQASIDSTTRAITLTADDTAVVTKRTIAWFHTLCVDTGENLSAIIPADPGSLNVGDKVMVKSYPESDTEFYNFYNKKVTAVTRNSIYDTVTVEHVLKGFAAGDILPESVWCLTFRPKSNPDGMVYDYDTDTAVDIYLQSGKGRNTKSVYGGTTTRTRQHQNHQADMNAVGKLLISDDEFTSAAMGSNEKTAIYGAAESSITTTGGHVDTASRRMISFLGTEDMCGGIWQWLRNVAAVGKIEESGQVYFYPQTYNEWATFDGVGNFGQTYCTASALIAGGAWNYGASSGSRSRRASDSRSFQAAGIGGRGVSRVIQGL